MRERLDKQLERLEHDTVRTEQDRLIVFMAASYLERDIADGEPNDEVHHEILPLNFSFNGESFQADIAPNLRHVLWQRAHQARVNLLKMGRPDIVTKAEHYVFEKFGKPKEVERT